MNNEILLVLTDMYEKSVLFGIYPVPLDGW